MVKIGRLPQITLCFGDVLEGLSKTHWELRYSWIYINIILKYLWNSVQEEPWEEFRKVRDTDLHCLYNGIIQNIIFSVLICGIINQESSLNLCVQGLSEVSLYRPNLLPMCLFQLSALSEVKLTASDTELHGGCELRLTSRVITTYLPLRIQDPHNRHNIAKV